jgi:hypothetical protein
MPELDVADVTRIATEVARERSLPLAVMGAVSGGGDSDYVEILLTVSGCASAPCQLTIGVFRNVSAEDLSLAIETQLRRHLDDHGASDARPSA